MSPELEAALKLFSNLAALGATPAGQAFLGKLLAMNDPTPAELDAAISQLPVPGTLPETKPEG
jgi:hypothetical protein